MLTSGYVTCSVERWDYSNKQLDMCLTVNIIFNQITPIEKASLPIYNRKQKLYARAIMHFHFFFLGMLLKIKFCINNITERL